MARISGVDIPNNKRLEIALTYIHGIGLSISNEISNITKIDKNKRVKDLTDVELGKIKKAIEENFRVEGALRTDVRMNIDRIRRIRSHKGRMHQAGLPVRGQRTKTNARTRKGPVKLAIKGKAKPGKK